jgi:hypothetical protein
VIRKRGRRWVLLDSESKEVLGTHRTRAAALRQERAIKLAKRKRKTRRKSRKR